MVNSRQAVKRLKTARANLNSVELQLRQQSSQLRVAGSLQQSADVMKAMNRLVRLPEIQKAMADMSKEMTKVNMGQKAVE